MAKKKKTYIEIKGIKEVMDELNKAWEQTKDKSIASLIRCSMLIREGTEKVYPKIPIDTGNMRASWFGIATKGEDSFKGTFKGKAAGQMKSNHQMIKGEVKQAVKQEKKPMVAFGYTANYSLYVHEMDGKDGRIAADFTRKKKVGGKLHKRREGAGAKWLESSMLRNKAELLKIIQGHINLK